MDKKRSSIDPERLLAQGQWMRSLARGLLGDDARAEDVVQEAWVAALARPPRAGGERGLRAWLAAVVGNLARRAHRRETLRPAIEERAARRESVPAADELVARIELQRRLAEAVLALEEPCRSAVLWRHLEGLGAEEIARRQGCTQAAARQRIARGIERLRQTLDARFGQRSAWTVALVPWTRSTGTPLATLPVATGLGGILMGSKLAALALACVSLATLAYVSRLERPMKRKPEPARGDALARTTESLPGALADAGELAPVERDVLREPLATEPSSASTVELHGLVHDPAGHPLAGANVILAASEDAARALVARGQAVAGWTVTDEAGDFRLELAASAATRGARDSQESAGFGLWVTRTGFLAAPLRALPGEALDVLLHRLPALEVVLQTAGDEQPSAREAHLWIRTPAGTIEEVSVAADAEGRLVALGLPVGRLERVRGRALGFGRAEEARDLELALDRSERLVLPLPPGATLQGIVLEGESDTPIPAAEVWAEDAWLDDESTTPRATSDESGHFELVGVELKPAGDERFLWTAVSARADGFVGRLLDMRILPRSAENRYFVEVRLTRAQGRLMGHVSLPAADGSLAGVAAQVLAIDGQSQFHALQANGAGDFTLEDLPAGKLELFLRTASEEPGGVRASLRTELELGPGEARSEDFTLERGHGTIEGVVRRRDDAPVAGATVTLDLHFCGERLAMNAEQRTDRTDAGGRFLFEGCSPGEFLLQLGSLPQNLVCEPGPGNFSLATGERRRFEFRAAPAIELAGRVELGNVDPAALRVVLQAAADGARLGESVVAAGGSFHFTGIYPLATELLLLCGEEELDRAPAGARGARNIQLRVAR